MTQYNCARALITAFGAVSLWAVATPAEATTISLTYDIELEFVGDHVRKLMTYNEDTGEVQTCDFGDTCYPNDWRPENGRYRNIEPGDEVNLGLSVDLAPRSSPSYFGDFDSDITSCSSHYGGCWLFGNSDYETPASFDATTGAIRLLSGNSYSGEIIDLFSSTLYYSSELGFAVPDYCYGTTFPDAPEGFCGYWDYEAHFNVISFSVEGLEEIPHAPVPPTLPLLASAIFGIAAMRRLKARSKV